MTAVDRAIAFLESQPRPVELAWARHTERRGGASEVSAALAGYQNGDGGFGQNLEVDIKAPDSQPFAARLAMQVAIDSRLPAADPVIQRLARWLETAQGEDGCWRLPATLFDHPIAPWFQGWPFPSLNPALDLAGLARRLGIGSERMFDRVRELAVNLTNLDQAESGEFYDVLPYAEYFPWIDHPGREAYLAAIARGVAVRADAGKYEDAGHFFTHAGGPENEISKRLPAELVQAQLDRLESEQEDDGGWPSPYEQLWRSWATADALSVLKAYGRTR